MKLYLYTEELFLFGRLKNFVKKFFNLEHRGPSAVLNSLVLGLKEIGADYSLNERPKEKIEIACVLNGVKTLAWAISRKRKGLIKSIVAGPNIVISPKDFGGILKGPLIDRVVAPSQWVKEAYGREGLEPEKIFCWAAGVDLGPLPNNEPKVLDFLIYDKTQKGELFLKICRRLDGLNLKYKVLEYGEFKKPDYLNLLGQAKFEIYLSETESQGLAMFEAWAQNVPTFIWERGYFERAGLRVEGNTASPFLTGECGGRFKDFQDFAKGLEGFMKADFQPRRYVENNFSHKIAAEKYLEIIKTVIK